jgi:hypothetical protein
VWLHGEPLSGRVGPDGLAVLRQALATALELGEGAGGLQVVAFAVDGFPVVFDWGGLPEASVLDECNGRVERLEGQGCPSYAYHLGFNATHVSPTLPLVPICLVGWVSRRSGCTRGLTFLLRAGAVATDALGGDEGPGASTRRGGPCMQRVGVLWIERVALRNRWLTCPSASGQSPV